MKPPETDLTAQSFDYLSMLIGASSLLMAIVAILIALVALPVFLFLRNHAGRVAREAAKEALANAAENAEKIAIARMEALLPSLLGEYGGLGKSGAISAEEANAIAASQGTDDEPNGRNQKSPKSRARRPQGPRG